jgi:flagellar basal-body rod protein FlgB
MSSIFNDQTMQGLQYALNSLSMRQQVLSNNIANAQTPGFISQDVSFEDQLATILGGQTDAAPGTQGEVVAAPDMTTTRDGNTVSLENQMTKESQTNIMFDALAQLTSDRLGILRTAING